MFARTAYCLIARPVFSGDVGFVVSRKPWQYSLFGALYVFVGASRNDVLLSCTLELWVVP